MWVKVDDALPSHPKVLEAGANLGRHGVGRVLAIWLQAICYSNHNLTDGFVPEVILRTWTMVDRKPLDVAFVMVSVGIFDEEPRGFRFHDYDDYQPTKVEVTARRKKDLARKTRAHVEAERGRIPMGFRPESDLESVVPRPDPSISTHVQDHRAPRGLSIPPLDSQRHLKALVWREVHAAHIEATEPFTYGNVLERVKCVAARAGFAYGGDWFCRQVEAAVVRVSHQRARQGAA